MLLATGGTIASRYDPKLGSTVASQRADELLKMLPQVADFADIEVHDLATIPSYDMDLAFAFGLAGRIRDTLSRPEVGGRGGNAWHGHDGGDLLSGRSAARLEKPAVFTGAQRATRPASDGPPNLLNALRAAASPLTRGLGAMICFNVTLHAARDVTKVHASAVETFQSYGHGALGEVDGNRVVIHRRPVLRRTFKIERLEERVELFRLVLGADFAGSKR